MCFYYFRSHAFESRPVLCTCAIPSISWSWDSSPLMASFFEAFFSPGLPDVCSDFPAPVLPLPSKKTGSFVDGIRKLLGVAQSPAGLPVGQGGWEEQVALCP